ncbi:somatostatin receptor type 1-like [Xyrauchen texanus]|uniref:somatostatin receptor type 1-like n=1 Tax=Xyrauchen texanus TaxID=154827 RepID=UPI0022423B2D|nr:somatostatin receptor type 1-like [Xyrauchen texanus]
MVEMNNSIVNFSTPHSSINLTGSSFWQMGTLEMSMLSFSFMLGLPTHSYIIYLIITETRSGMASEFFSLNLSVCEILFSLNSMFTLLTNWFPSLATLMQFLLGELITGHPLFQCLMCVERYLAVVHPVTFLKFKPLRYRVICSTAAWIICLGSCLCCMFLLASFNNFIYTWFFVIQFLLYLSIQLFCCLAVLRALKQSGPGDRGRERGEENNVKKRAFYIILISTLRMVITYVPFTVTGVLAVLTQQSIQVLWSISFICFMLAGFVQPVFYLHRTGKLSCLCYP